VYSVIYVHPVEAMCLL